MPLRSSTRTITHDDEGSISAVNETASRRRRRRRRRCRPVEHARRRRLDFTMRSASISLFCLSQLIFNAVSPHLHTALSTFKIHLNASTALGCLDRELLRRRAARMRARDQFVVYVTI